MADNDEIQYQGRSEDEFSKLTEQFRTPSYKDYVAMPAPGWDVEGIWHCFGSGHRTGYATHAVSLHWMLQKVLGIETQLVPHRNLDVDIEKFPADRYDMLFEWHKAAVGVPHAYFCSFPPDTAAEMDGIGPPLIPYCAFEGTKVSTYCRDLCNGNAFEQVWVVSDFVRDAMIAGGVYSDRVRTVRPMLCGGPWAMTPASDLQSARLRPVTQEDPFVFGVLGTWQKRKGMHDLVRAFFSEFKREEPVTLVIRTSVFGDNLTIRKFKEKLTEEMAEIAAEFGDSGFPTSQKQPKVRFVLGTDSTDQEIIDWLGQLDCYANPSYGEGLGIPHVWAKAQGVPMISSGYGAVGEMLEKLASHADSVFPYRLEPVDPVMCRYSLMFDRDVEWGVYDVADLAKAMRHQFSQSRRLDTKGMEQTRSDFSEEACSQQVLDGLRSFLSEDVLSKWVR